MLQFHIIIQSLKIIQEPLNLSTLAFLITNFQEIAIVELAVRVLWLIKSFKYLTYQQEKQMILQKRQHIE